MSGKKIQQTPRLASTQEHYSTRAHLQETLPPRIFHQARSNYFKEVQNLLLLLQRCLSLSTLQLLNKSMIDLVKTLMGSIAVNTTKKPRIYSKTTHRNVHPILTSPKKKGRLSKPSRKMTHG